MGVYETGQSRLLTDEFGNDEPCPGPTQQDAQIIVKLGKNSWNNHSSQQLPSIGSEGLGRFQKGLFEHAGGVGDHQNQLKEGADEDQHDLGSIRSTQKSHEEYAEGRRWHVAEKIHERLVKFGKEIKGAAQNRQWDAQEAGIGEAPKYHT